MIWRRLAFVVAGALTALGAVAACVAVGESRRLWPDDDKYDLW